MASLTNEVFVIAHEPNNYFHQSVVRVNPFVLSPSATLRRALSKDERKKNDKLEAKLPTINHIEPK